MSRVFKSRLSAALIKVAPDVFSSNHTSNAVPNIYSVQYAGTFMSVTVSMVNNVLLELVVKKGGLLNGELVHCDAQNTVLYNALNCYV